MQQRKDKQAENGPDTVASAGDSPVKLEDGGTLRVPVIEERLSAAKQEAKRR